MRITGVSGLNGGSRTTQFKRPTRRDVEEMIKKEEQERKAVVKDKERRLVECMTKEEEGILSCISRRNC
jgi:hypothetical protein